MERDRRERPEAERTSKRGDDAAPGDAAHPPEDRSGADGIPERAYEDAIKEAVEDVHG